MNNQKPIKDYLFFQEGPGVRKNQYTTSGIKLLNVANLVDGQVDLSTSDRYISEEEAYGKYNHFLVDEGDLVIASSGIKVEYFDKKMGFVNKEQLPLCMNTSTIRFKSLNSNEVDIRYFMYYLKSDSFKQQLFKQITGSAQLNFGPSHLSKMTFPLISLNKQKKLIIRLDKINNVINNKTEQLNKIDYLIKSRFIETFGDMSAIKNKKDFVPLGDVCDIRDGTHDSPKYYSKGYPLVTSKNVTSGQIDFSTCSLISKEDYDKINTRSKVDIGDILMPMIGTVGNPIIVNTDKEFAIKNVALLKFSDDASVTNVFVKALLESSYFDMEIISKIRGGTQKFISLGDIRKLPILVPSLELQYGFSNFVEQVNKSKFDVQKSIDELQTLYDSLMQKYFG